MPGASVQCTDCAAICGSMEASLLTQEGGRLCSDRCSIPAPHLISTSDCHSRHHGAPSPCQPFRAAEELSQAGTWRDTPTEAGPDARGVGQVASKALGAHILTPPLGSGLQSLLAQALLSPT